MILTDPEWQECENCGGDGYTSHECGDDTCACWEPSDNVPCFVCNGTGGWKGVMHEG
jgi:hypothetical protein